MSNDNLIYLLIQVHDSLVNAAKLSEGIRPYLVQSHLNGVEKHIMEELKKYDIDNNIKPTPNLTDDIPF